LLDATCYVQKGKAKSEQLCRAFAAGVSRCNGAAQVIADASRLLPGAAVFYGVRPNQAHILDAAMEAHRDWYYIDNAYFDPTREVYYRITRNRLQHHGVDASDGTRFASLKIPIHPWRKSGSHILLCPQSDEFLDLFCGQGAKWTHHTLNRLSEITPRELRVRPWKPNKVEWYRTLPEDLEDCWALVTYSSASAITAMLNGIPAFVTAEDCISAVVANRSLDTIEHPYYWHNLLPWCNVIADNQFTVEEIASGYAWRRLHAADRAV
jgi:hypothetical protein